MDMGDMGEIGWTMNILDCIIYFRAGSGVLGHMDSNRSTVKAAIYSLLTIYVHEYLDQLTKPKDKIYTQVLGG